jgi:hypothetical protein
VAPPNGPSEPESILVQLNNIAAEQSNTAHRSVRSSWAAPTTEMGSKARVEFGVRMRIEWSPLFGYDIFISYRRGDGSGGSSEYAAALRSKLQEAEFQCFLDNDDAPVGESLNPAIRRGLGRSRAMVVLCTPGSLKSVWVADEVRYFSKKRNPALIPVNFSGCLESLTLKETAFSSLVDLGIIWLNENNPTEPSDSVLGGIQARFKYRRANTLRTWFLSVVALLLGIVATIALI